MIVGPNGAGKSTIINAISQGVPYTGDVYFADKNIKKYKAHDRAKIIGVLAQNNPINYSFTVQEVIRLGRYSYAPSIFSRTNKDDEEHILKAIEMTGLSSLLHQPVLTLSGGELQRFF